MGIKKTLIKEAPWDSPTPADYGIDSPYHDFIPGEDKFNVQSDKALTGLAGVEAGVAAGREIIGNTPISQGLINLVVLDYLDGTGEFEFYYSFLKDVTDGGKIYKAGETFTTKKAKYYEQGNMIVVGPPTSSDGVDDKEEEDVDDEKVVDNEVKKDQDNRNQKLVKLFKTIGITFDVKDPFIHYVRKNIRQILRRIKAEFPEYGIEFRDQPTKWEGEEVIVDGFLTTGSILLEEYKESIRHLMDLHKGKTTHKKDKGMVDIFDKEIKKEKDKLIKIVKPRFTKIFGKHNTSLKDEDMLKLGMYLSTFLKGLQKDYPQYKIKHGQMRVDEAEEREVGTPKSLSIIFEPDVKEIWIGKTYPCKVKVGESEEKDNTVKIVDVISPYVYKGGAQTKKGGSGKKDDKCPEGQKWNPETEKCEETKGEYEFPSGLTNRQDKGKRFWVTMEITTAPATYLSPGFETDILKADNEYVYVVEMLFNGFELERINSSAFPNQNFEGNKIRFIFPEEVKKVIFDKEYQVEVKKGETYLGSLNIIVANIVKK